MKKIAGLLLCGGLLFNSLYTQAQSFAESALLYSRTNPGGSARVQGMGGAQVSLGGDYSSAFSNPAGLGMYNRSELTLTPGFGSSHTSSSYIGNTTTASQSNINLQGLSAVFHWKKDEGKFLGFTFGASYNRTNDFNRTFSYTGVNTNSSIIDYFSGYANSFGQGPGQLFYTSTTAGTIYETPTRLAYDNYLINPKSQTDSTHYATDVGGVPTQHETVRTSGSQGQFNFSGGVNVGDRLFLGLGIGIARLNYQSTRTYSESFSTLPLNSLTYVDVLNTRGTGINATFGAIYRPFDFVQFGVSVATPTSYRLHDTDDAAMGTDWNAAAFGTLYGATTQLPPTSSIDTQFFDYNLTTPWRTNVGVTFLIQKHGFISADVESLNYSNSHYSSASDGSSFSGDNSDIKTYFRSILNYRVGGEYRLKKFRFRLGYNAMPDPYNQSQLTNLDHKFQTIMQSVSAGAGYRTNNFFVDLAVILRNPTFLTSTPPVTSYRPYIGDNPLVASPLVTTQGSNTFVMVTVGYILKAREPGQGGQSRPMRQPRPFRQF